jgi:hypothetical protein
MAYTDTATVKQYLGIDSSDHDALIGNIITRTQKAIESYCDRVFEAASATRYYDVTGSRTLFLDDDLLTVTTLTNGDDTEIAASDYQLLPLNESPKYAIRLKENSNINWEDDSDGNREGVISVAGTWGWTTAVPADIAHACIRLAAYYFKQREAQVFDVTAIPDQGAIIIPKGIPPDVKMILDHYRKPSL